MGQIFGGLVLAVVTSLGFVAYKHPKEYQILSVILSCVVIALSALAATWNFAVSSSASAVLSVPFPDSSPVLQPSGSAEAVQALNNNIANVEAREKFRDDIRGKIKDQQIYPDFAPFVAITAMGYLWTLNFLPVLGIVDKKEQAAPKGPKKKKSEAVPPE